MALYQIVTATCKLIYEKLESTVLARFLENRDHQIETANDLLGLAASPKNHEVVTERHSQDSVTQGSMRQDRHTLHSSLYQNTLYMQLTQTIFREYTRIKK